MKKKILIATTILSLAVAGVVSAASIWGTYKGNDIIRLTVNGDPVKVSDVPAISYNDRTMIPIYLLPQAGINYTWDQKNRTVNIVSTKPSQETTVQPKQVGVDYYDVYQKLSKYGVIGISSQADFSNGTKFDYVVINLNIPATSLSDQALTAIITEIGPATASQLVLYFSDGSNYIMNFSDIQLWLDGKIDSTIMSGRMTYQPANYTPSSTGTSTNNTIVSKIDGDFNGFNYGNVYILQNGQIWKQTSYDIKVSYKYSPKVTIYKDGIYYYMIVDGVDKQIKVELVK